MFAVSFNRSIILLYLTYERRYSSLFDAIISAEAPSIHTETVNVPASGTLSKSGTFILSAVGANGATLTFGLTSGQIGNLINKVSQDADAVLSQLTTIEDIVKYLTKQNLSLIHI